MLDLNQVEFSRLSPDEEAVFRWQYGYHEKWTFWWLFWETVKQADDFNMLRLEQGFPVEIQGLRQYRTQEGWWQEVERKAVDRLLP